MEHACEITGLVKRFGPKTAVDRLSLSVPAGMLYGFLGVNGAGKTTTLRMISGLIRPDAGAIRVCGIDAVAEPQRAKQPLAYVLDDPVLYGKLNPMEHLEFVAALWNVDPAVARQRAQELLERLGLWDRRHEWIESYSRGMKQKIALASALIHTPKLILLDEPLTGLDASAARLVKDILLEFLRHGGSVILTTHILEVAERLAERIGIMSGGRLIAEGTMAQLRSHSGQAAGSLEDIFLQLIQQG
ncbi:MAG TPA: ABC transporter ATP-binding protein [Candidatus Methylacidiphilales bacterium]|jgi:ABC-2 type transport system ATP-binding protein|nr:ABC transporter ATP-binding protein [Candidatus Methylacidiphilales bacterium]